MLAFSLPIALDTTYPPRSLALHCHPSSAFAFDVANRPRISCPPFLGAALLGGVSLHALRRHGCDPDHAMITYEPGLLLLSIGIAIGLRSLH